MEYQNDTLQELLDSIISIKVNGEVIYKKQGT